MRRAPTRQTGGFDLIVVSEVGYFLSPLGLEGLVERIRLGLAVPDRGDLDAKTWAHWQERHSGFSVGPHVHGANLGFRLDDYRAACGWQPLGEHEDQRLVDDLLAGGVPAGAGLEVISSGRVDGRVRGGFSGYLRTILELAVTEDAVEPG